MTQLNDDVDGTPNHSPRMSGESGVRSLPSLDPLREAANKVDIDIEVEQNSGTVIGVQVIAQFGRMLEPQPLGDGLLTAVRKVFRKPTLRARNGIQYFDDLVSTFLEPGTIVVIGGKGGTGRTITAIALLEALSSKSGAAVSTIGYGASRKFQAARLPQQRKHGYLLELPVDDAEFEISSDFGVVLHDVQLTLRQQSSHLVIVTTDEQWQRIGLGAPVSLVTVNTVSNWQIMRSWLTFEAPDVATSSWVEDLHIQQLVEREKTPQGVVEIVGLIVRAGRSVPDRLPTLDEIDEDNIPSGLRDADIDSRRRIASVVAARNSWRPHLLTWHREPARNGFERNFLLAAAILPDAPAGEVYAAARTLTRRFGEESPGIGQEGPGVIQLADLVEAELVGESDILVFPRPGWEDAVMQYFWVDRPESRQAFLTWIAQAPLEMSREVLTFAAGNPSTNRTQRAQRMASFALRWASRQRRPEYLNEIVSAWHGNKDLWPAAIEALTKACFDNSIGKDTHSLLLNWSQQRNPALRTAVADVCRDDFGRAYPGKALVRLAHVGESENQGVIEASRNAIQTLWEDDSLRSTILTEVLKWCESNNDARRAAGRRAFLTLADTPYAEEPDWPDLLTSHEKISDEEYQTRLTQTAKGWYYVLDCSDWASEARPASARWFNSCLRFPESRKGLIGVFHEAVSKPARDGSVLHHRLLDLLYEWNPGEGMEDLRDQVRHDFVDALLPHGSAIPPRVVGS